MRPRALITVDGAAAGAVLTDRLLSLSLTDQAGMESDRLELVLDDRAPIIAPPARGVLLGVRLGYGEALSDMGLWRVDRASRAADPARTLIVSATAADMAAGLKEPRRRAFEGETLASLGAQIAAAHGLEPAFAPATADIQIGHLSQAGESDMHLLTRLGLAHGLTVKAAAGRLVIAGRGESAAVTGAPMPVIALTPQDCAAWRAEFEDREAYGSVSASYMDYHGGGPKSVAVGAGGGPTMAMRHIYTTQSSAERAAKARLYALRAAASTFGATCKGDPRLSAEARLSLSGFAPDVDGLWVVSSVTHRLDQAGYACDLEAEAPQE